MKKCVFAGTFDPITLGHEHIIEKASMMFEEVVVAIGVNPQKKCLFSLEQRLEMLSAVCSNYRNVSVTHYENMFPEFIKTQNTNCLVRGVRNDKDIEYENKCYNIAISTNPDIELMIFQSPKNLINVSSTLVKDCLKKGTSVKKYVPEVIIPLLEKYYKK